YFFFQAEDGIRDFHVTGVQTCALPIYFIDFTADIITKLGKIDHTIASLDARKSVFRINRDIRFSPDKTPYKTHIAFALKPQHLKIGRASCRERVSISVVAGATVKKIKI